MVDTASPSSSPERSDRFWDLLSNEDRTLLDHIGKIRNFGPNETLLHEAEPSSHVLVLRMGWVKVTCCDSDGREVVLALRGPGDILGEMEVMIDDPRRSAAIRTLQNNVEALVIPAQRFTEFLDRAYTAWRALYIVLALRLRESNRNAREFGRSGVRQALARLLVDFARNHGEPVKDGIAVRVLSQDEVAACIWTSRDAVARELQALRKQGILSTGRRVITIIDFARLQDIARPGDR